MKIQRKQKTFFFLSTTIKINLCNARIHFPYKNTFIYSMTNRQTVQATYKFLMGTNSFPTWQWVALPFEHPIHLQPVYLYIFFVLYSRMHNYHACRMRMRVKWRVNILFPNNNNNNSKKQESTSQFMLVHSMV